MNLYDYKQELDQEGILLSFSGPMTHEMIEGVGRAIRVKIEGGEDGDKKAALKVFSIFVEQVENVIRYSVEKDHVDSNMSFGIIVIGKKDGHFYIIGGNKIETEKQQTLESYLEQLAAMNKDELKVFYKKRRRAERSGDSKGAGIGFIEMARKSSQPLEFNFQKVDDIHSFFTIKITI
ncbi:MAG: SiaB family protein kinase [gamma proteobacterium symbiont of Taylorina sp.]|nr:SiaB family protein kinase [gamma proteobacterium symbiont of Taylorina sp.]